MRRVIRDCRRAADAALIVCAAFAATQPIAAYANEVSMTVPMHYRTANPCTGNPLLIAGNIYIVGQFRDTGGGYHFSGHANYGYLTARNPNNGRVYEAIRDENDRLNVYVDIPVDKTVTQRVTFEGSERRFTALITSRVTAGLFGRDVDIVGVNLLCPDKESQPKGNSEEKSDDQAR